MANGIAPILLGMTMVHSFKPKNIAQFLTLRFPIFISYYSLLVGTLLCPPIFDRVFAMVHLLDRERSGLWVLSLCVILIAFLIRFNSWKPLAVSFLIFNGLFVTSVELSSRAIVKIFNPSLQEEVARWGNMSYDDFPAYKGHPFLQFTGVPSDHEGKETLNPTKFNNLGFHGPRDFIIQKPQNTIRIATIGGSTTANEYPRLLEEYLNEIAMVPGEQVEALNFGMAFWTTAHSLVNFTLNVIDFNPDYVVIHHAWNDGKARRTASNFRRDYSHALKVFELPSFIIDRYIIRLSVPYRYLKFRFGPAPPWSSIEQATVVPREKTAHDKNLDLLITYRRNIETMIDLAKVRHIKVLLTTMPHSNDPQKKYYSSAKHIDQANEILRDIARKYSETILFLDLDHLMTGKMESVFRDVAHVTSLGREFKAQQIGQTILEDLRLSGRWSET